MSFEFEQTPLEGAVIIKPDVYGDERGFLLETYDKSAFESEGIATEFLLEFYSRSRKNVLRGLHQQLDPFQQAKIVRCFSGKIFDAIVDIRPDSSTYGEYATYILSDVNKHSLFIPRGFLHGFVTLSEESLVHYKVDNKYAPDHEQGVIWNDPNIGIEWPLEDPILSDKDQQWPQLSESPYART